MTARVLLSQSETGKAWLAQFRSADDMKAAGELLDAMLLLNDNDVADAIRDSIDELANDWQGRGRSLPSVSLTRERRTEALTSPTLRGASADVPSAIPGRSSRRRARCGSEARGR